MYQSSPRKNFLDFLIDPTSIAILGSIALHAILGASLPFFTQLEKEIKKADPGTVKVVQLTPNELQRIPQAPPTPAPQIATPPPVVPSPQVVAPSTPPISPNSPTIPFSPIRIPLEKINPQPAKGKKDQSAIPQKQPTAPLFDRNISFNPTPKPTKSPDKKASTPKPTPIPKPVPIPVKKKPKVTTVNPIPSVDSDDDGGNLQPTDPATAPSTQAQKPANTPPASTANSTRPVGQSGTQPSGTPGNDRNSFPPFYGKYSAAALARLEQYERAYPGITRILPKSILQPYPAGTVCPKVKETPFIVLMVAFDKVPEQKEGNPLGESSAPSIDEPYVAGERDTEENRTLAGIAVNTALYDANKTDQNRPAADRGKRVLYQYRVQFDKTTCKR